MENQKAQLKKNIGLVTATSIVVGIVIGSGVFVKPGTVLLQTGSSTKALLAWLVGGLMTIAAGLTIAEVAARIPKTGGIYTYIDELYGAKLSFLCGWVLTFLYSPGLKGALSLYFATLAQPLLGYSTEVVPVFAIGTLLFLATMNSLSTKVSGYLTTVTCFIKLIPIFLIACVGLFSGNQSVVSSIDIPVENLSFGAAVLSTLWAYDGWMLVGNMAGEMKNPVRHLPMAIIGGLSLVIVAYLGVNVALFKVLPIDQIAQLGPKAANASAEVLFGEWGGKLISIGILVSIFGCLNSDILSGPRVPYAMASRGNLKYGNFISYVHPKFNTPINAILLQVIVAIGMILLANVNQITDFAIFSVYIFYVFAFAGVFLLRQKGDLSVSAYRAPLYPVIPIIAILSALYIIGSTVIDQPKLALISVGITLLGYPVYLFTKKQ